MHLRISVVGWAPSGANIRLVLSALFPVRFQLRNSVPSLGAFSEEAGVGTQNPLPVLTGLGPSGGPGYNNHHNLYLSNIYDVPGTLCDRCSYWHTYFMGEDNKIQRS